MGQLNRAYFNSLVSDLMEWNIFVFLDLAKFLLLMPLADLNAMTSEANSNKANLYSVFVDMENAFLRV